MTVRLTALDNGLRVVTDEMPHLETASVGVWVDAGARQESAGQHGIAHLLEHMAFKGTGRRSARQIAEEIESVGGELNAATSIESTAYFARVLKADVPVALNILADIVIDPVFDETELQREKSVIAQEIAAVNDMPDDLVFDYVQETAFPDQSLGRPILGTVETLAGFSRDDLALYREQHYRPSAMVVGATGAVDHDEVVEMAATLFDLEAGEAADAPAPARYVGGERRAERELEQAHLIFAFEGTSYFDPDVYSARVFASALGGGMSSRLFQSIREERGLAYSIFAFAASYRDSGLFGIYSATAPESVHDLTGATADEVARAARSLTGQEIARARAQIKSGLMMSLESSSSRLEQIARQVGIFGRVLATEEIVARIDAVDEAAVRGFAERLITRSPLSVGAIGPLAGLANHSRLAESFAM
jgi:predicted Zn-dependent peptidase